MSLSVIERYRWWTIDHPILSAPFWAMELVLRAVWWLFLWALAAVAVFTIFGALSSLAERMNVVCNPGYHAERHDERIDNGSRKAWLCFPDAPE